MITTDYSDSTFMPFGKYTGSALGDIRKDDPGYFVYLWEHSNEGATLSNAKLAKYIKIKFEVEALKQKRFNQRRYEGR